MQRPDLQASTPHPSRIPLNFARLTADLHMSLAASSVSRSEESRPCPGEGPSFPQERPARQLIDKQDIPSKLMGASPELPGQVAREGGEGWVEEGSAVGSLAASDLVPWLPWLLPSRGPLRPPPLSPLPSLPSSAPPLPHPGRPWPSAPPSDRPSPPHWAAGGVQAPSRPAQALGVAHSREGERSPRARGPSLVDGVWEEVTRGGCGRMHMKVTLLYLLLSGIFIP